MENLVKEVAEYIVREGTNNSLSGNWIIYLDELDTKFGININWFEDNGDNLEDTLWKFNEVMDVDINIDKEYIDVIYGTAYCKLMWVEHPYQVFGLYQDENHYACDGEINFGEFDTEEEATECAKSITSFCDAGASTAAKYMYIQVELVTEDEDKNSEAADILYKSEEFKREV